MATLTFTNYAIDGDLDGNSGTPFSDGFVLSNSADGSGPPTELSDGDTIWFSQGGGPFEQGIFRGSFASTDGSVNGFVIQDAAGTQPGYVFSDDTIPDPMSYILDTSGTLTVCFAAGTLIATLEGEVTVETLRVGDAVKTVDGRTVPVKWIGRQSVLAFFAGDRACPVRIAKDALAEGVPHTDLVLTADHALIMDGAAINAGALVNGTTITLDPAPEQATYYHVETEDHEIILANGVPAETYVDYVQRRAFDNYQEYRDLYGEERTIREMGIPRVSSARLVPPSIRARLAGRKVA